MRMNDYDKLWYEKVPALAQKFHALIKQELDADSELNLSMVNAALIAEMATVVECGWNHEYRGEVVNQRFSELLSRVTRPYLSVVR